MAFFLPQDIYTPCQKPLHLCTTMHHAPIVWTPLCKFLYSNWVINRSNGGIVSCTTFVSTLLSFALYSFPFSRTLLGGFFVSEGPIFRESMMIWIPLGMAIYWLVLLHCICSLCEDYESSLLGGPWRVASVYPDLNMRLKHIKSCEQLPWTWGLNMIFV